MAVVAPQGVKQVLLLYHTWLDIVGVAATRVLQVAVLNHRVTAVFGQGLVAQTRLTEVAEQLVAPLLVSVDVSERPKVGAAEQL